MSDTGTWLPECPISEGPAEACALVATAAAPPDAGSGIVAMFRGPAARRLVRVTWQQGQPGQPGRGLRAEPVELLGDLPEDLHCATLAGHRLVVGDSDGKVLAVNCSSGHVSRIENLPVPVVFAPDGRTLVSATGRGLLVMTLWGKPDGPVIPGDIEPLLVTPLDPDTMAVVPDTGPDTGPEAGDGGFVLAIGCHGRVVLVRASLGLDEGGERHVPAEARTVATALPADPHHIVNPAALPPPLAGRWIFTVDEGRCGLAAIDSGSGRVAAFPTDLVGYGTVRTALPSLDWSTCLVELKDGSAFLWSPERDIGPRRIAPASGRVLLWQGDRALVLDRDHAVLRETSVPEGGAAF